MKKGILNFKIIVERGLYPSEKMVESQPKDALVKLVKLVKLVETVFSERLLLKTVVVSKVN